MPSYVYTPFDLAVRQIRLLTLHPGLPQDPICVELCPHVLDSNNPPSYEALSYTWGEKQDLKTVNVGSQDSFNNNKHGCNPQLKVTPNLASALVHLRDTNFPRTIWIDAICINQRDSKELGHQVAFMAQIYHSAARVLIFLGEAADDSDHAMHLITHIGAQIAVNWFSFDTTPAPGTDSDPVWSQHALPAPWNLRDLRSLQALLTRPWFRRLWIRQEARACNTTSLVICGSAQVSWEVFRRFVIVLWSKFQYASKFGHTYPVDLIETAKFVLGLCRETQRYQLGTILEASQQSLCYDPRDRVYAILAFDDSAVLREKVVPDYDKAVADVYRDLILQHMWIDGDIGILSQCGLHVASDGFPSWVRDWRLPLLYARAVRRGPNYSTGWSEGDVQYRGNGVLTASGTKVVGTIYRMWPIRIDKADGSMVFEGLSALHELSISRVEEPTTAVQVEHLLNAFCRTICNNALYENYDPPLKRAASLSQARALLREQVAHPNTTNGEGRQFLLQASPTFHEAREYCTNRSIFITEDGTLGLGPGDARVGDEIVGLLGSKAPFVLRPAKDNQHQLIGECYLDNQMDAQGLFGRLPLAFEPVATQTDEGWVMGFRNITTGEVQLEDPRVVALKEERLSVADQAMYSDVPVIISATFLKKVGVEHRCYELI